MSVLPLPAGGPKGHMRPSLPYQNEEAFTWHWRALEYFLPCLSLCWASPSDASMNTEKKNLTLPYSLVSLEKFKYFLWITKSFLTQCSAIIVEWCQEEEQRGKGRKERIWLSCCWLYSSLVNNTNVYHHTSLWLFALADTKLEGSLQLSGKEWLFFTTIHSGNFSVLVYPSMWFHDLSYLQNSLKYLDC